MTRQAPKAPQGPALPDRLERCDVDLLSHEDTFEAVEIYDSALNDQRANGLTFEATRLCDVSLASCGLDDLRVFDSAFVRCNLANTEVQRGALSTVSITASRLTGIRLVESTLRDVTIRDSRVDLASFSFGSLTSVTFEDCVLTQTDFLDTKLNSVRFHNCDLEQGDFRGANLKSCEFRSCNLNGLHGIESLRGAAMEWSDIVAMAGVWAAALGIEVLDG